MDSDVSASGSDAEESKLGRLDHWESVYAVELRNLSEHGDEGEVWFGEEVLSTVVAWTDRLLRSRSQAALNSRILDVGAGNGTLLLGLHALGYRRLTGSDYSAKAVALAAAVAERRCVTGIRWVLDDLLDTALRERFDVIVDKGTLDAVGLSADGRHNRLRYRQSVWSLLAHEGLLIVTSCNSTLQELQEEFCSPWDEQDEQDSAHFECVDHVKTYPTFSFGGFTGSKVCTACFCRTGE